MQNLFIQKVKGKTLINNKNGKGLKRIFQHIYINLFDFGYIGLLLFVYDTY